MKIKFEIIEDRKKRIRIYLLTLAVSILLQLVNYVLFLRCRDDGMFFMFFSVAIIPAVVYFAGNFRFLSGLLAAGCLSFGPVLFYFIDELCDFTPIQGGWFYGLGWVVSMIIWFVAPLGLYLIGGAIAWIIRINQSPDKEKENGADSENNV